MKANFKKKRGKKTENKKGEKKKEIEGGIITQCTK